MPRDWNSYGIMVPYSDTGMTINPFSVFILDEIEIFTASWFYAVYIDISDMTINPMMQCRSTYT